jgi:hypothetical protein
MEERGVRCLEGWEWRELARSYTLGWDGMGWDGMGRGGVVLAWLVQRYHGIRERLGGGDEAEKRLIPMQDEGQTWASEGAGGGTPRSATQSKRNTPKR